MKDTEYLVIESTYGDRLHSEERVDYVKELAARIQKVLDRGGNMIIPSFAVGRTQEILYFIREIKEKNLVTGHGDFPVYMDSPLAIEATSIFLQCDTQFVDEEMQALIRSGVNPIVFPGLELAVSQEESKAINEDKTPKIIISASGMCDAGRVRHHLKHNLWRPESMVLFVGYQAVGTLGRVLVDGCLHAEYTCNDDVAAGVAAFAKEKGLHMHVHLSETDSEHRQCLARHGCTPAAWMEGRGVFDVPCSAAHCVWVTPEDRAIFRRRGVSVIHNPSSNMKLGSGFAPVPELLAEGVNVALGTDGAASNNNLDMVEELHLAAILHKGRRHDAAAVPCNPAIAMATRGGAVAQGRADCGILAPGMRADLMAIDLDRPHLTPCLDAAALVTYSAQSADVCLTMADGEILYENGDYLTLDREKILFEARAAARRIYG